jgi:lysine-N-methylase
MPTPPIEVPSFQNWSCHNCGGCCRQHLIEINEEERARIDSQNWGATGGVALPVYVPHGRGFRLAHNPDGSCVFLDERGLCRVHAKFGEAAKPLACQIYPYAFHPGGRKIAVSLRFSCPSVVANRGTPLARQMTAIAALAARVAPAGADRIPAPLVAEAPGPTWPDFFRFLRRLDLIVAQTGAPVARRILVVLKWLDLIESAGTAALSGPDLDEVLAALAASASADLTTGPDAATKPGAASLGPFRLLLLQYARKDTGGHLQRIWSYRWKLLRAALRFALGSGRATPMQDGFKPVAFADLEKSFGGIPPESEETLVRFFRVKIQGIHFCGPAYYQIPFIEGFRHLALLFAATLWMARWLAAGEGRTTLAPEDIAKALAVADHPHGYSPAFGSANFRRRARMLAKTGDIARLIAWYSR